MNAATGHSRPASDYIDAIAHFRRTTNTAVTATALTTAATVATIAAEHLDHPGIPPFAAGLVAATIALYALTLRIINARNTVSRLLDHLDFHPAVTPRELTDTEPAAIIDELLCELVWLTGTRWPAAHIRNIADISARTLYRTSGHPDPDSADAAIRQFRNPYDAGTYIAPARAAYWRNVLADIDTITTHTRGMYNDQQLTGRRTRRQRIADNRALATWIRTHPEHVELTAALASAYTNRPRGLVDAARLIVTEPAR